MERRRHAALHPFLISIAALVWSLLALVLMPPPAAAGESELRPLIQALADGKFDDKAEAIAALVATGDPAAATILEAMADGVANKFLEPYAGAVLAKIFVLVLIILFIQKRPRGLFALKGRSVEA